MDEVEIYKCNGEELQIKFEDKFYYPANRVRVLQADKAALEREVAVLTAQTKVQGTWQMREQIKEQAQQIKELVEGLSMLMYKNCFCEVSIGNPNLAGIHTPVCAKLIALLAQHKQTEGINGKKKT